MQSEPPVEPCVSTLAERRGRQQPGRTSGVLGHHGLRAAAGLMVTLLAAGCDPLAFSGCFPDTDGPTNPDPSDAGTPSPGATVASTSLGDAHGFVTDEGVVAFLGMPYAEPPLGDLRFAPPVELGSWGGPIEADAFGPACPQPAIGEVDTLNSRIDEDCLTLNVWTPAADDGERAVMFWIHGGGYIWESSGDTLYQGARMAARGDVVVVSVEYRLGAMGFSHLDEEPGSGNAGVLDPVMALRWVRDHISAFGGDPDNVTIWGESAGSYSVTALLGMPSASGLFHRAIGQSGGSSNVRSAEYAAEATRLLFEQAGVTTLAELRALSWQDVVAAQEGVMGGTLLPEAIYGPVVDGVVFAEPPLTAIANGSANDLPLLVGFTRDEGRWWMVETPILRAPIVTPLVMSLAFPYLGRAIPERQNLLHAEWTYNREYPLQALSPNLQAIAMTADVMLRIPTIRHAEAQVPHTPANVFVYRFDWEPPAPAYPLLDLGAPHGAELGFTMGYPEGWPELYGEDGIPAGLRDQIMDAWIAFAKTGDPNHGAMPTWHPYDLSDRPTMLFNARGDAAASELEHDPDGRTREFWEGRAFDGTDPPFLPEDLSGAALLSLP